MNVSFKGRIFPSASNTFKPSSPIFFFAVSVGADRLKITFLRAVPPSYSSLSRLFILELRFLLELDYIFIFNFTC
nr:MAG TPA: hypothetical protein [Bacteriophage sp.]